MQCGWKRTSLADAPRRYGIGTMTILTVVFALLFGVLNMYDVPPAPFAFISVLVAEVAACQVLLFKGKNPRAASIVGGSVILYFMAVVASLTTVFGPRDFTRETTFSLDGMLWLLLIGAFLGYLVGTLIAVVFWLCRKSGGAMPETPNAANGGSPHTEISDWLDGFGRPGSSRDNIVDNQSDGPST